MNTKLAAVGLFLVVLALAVGSGAFESGDELTGAETNESVYFAPTDTPTGNAYAEFEEGKITLTVDRLNPSAETLIDDLFEVGYGGRGTAEVWIEHNSDQVTFYDETRSPVENENPGDRMILNSGENATFGIGVVSGSEPEILSQVTLVAILPTEEEDIVVSPPDDDRTVSRPGDDDGTTPRPDEDIEEVTPPISEPEPDTDTDTGTDSGGSDRSRLTVDIGDINVRFRQPQFRFTTDVSENEIGVGSSGISGGIATVIDTEQPATEETVVVTSTVENTGDTFGTTVAELRVNGRILDTRELDLEANESTTVEFAISFDEPGRYEVAVGDSEPETVFVTESSSGLLIPALLAAILSLIVLFMIYRRRQEEEDEEPETQEPPQT